MTETYTQQQLFNPNLTPEQAQFLVDVNQVRRLGDRAINYLETNGGVFSDTWNHEVSDE